MQQEPDTIWRGKGHPAGLTAVRAYHGTFNLLR